MSSASTLSAGKWLNQYADSQHVSVDGCRSAFDVEQRKVMLRNIEKAYDQGWLKP